MGRAIVRGNTSRKNSKKSITNKDMTNIVGENTDRIDKDYRDTIDDLTEDVSYYIDVQPEDTNNNINDIFSNISKNEDSNEDNSMNNELLNHINDLGSQISFGAETENNRSSSNSSYDVRLLTSEEVIDCFPLRDYGDCYEIINPFLPQNRNYISNYRPPESFKLPAHVNNKPLILPVDCTGLFSQDLLSMCGAPIKLCFKNIDLSQLYYKNVDIKTTMNMFSGDTELESVILDNFWGAKLESTVGMFENCSKLKYIDLSNFSTEASPKYIDSMFKGCTSLETVSMLSFSIAGNFDYTMFSDCPNLQQIHINRG